MKHHIPLIVMLLLIFGLVTGAMAIMHQTSVTNSYEMDSSTSENYLYSYPYSEFGIFNQYATQGSYDYRTGQFNLTIKALFSISDNITSHVAELTIRTSRSQELFEITEQDKFLLEADDDTTNVYYFETNQLLSLDT